jgi:hypothetical protein
MAAFDPLRGAVVPLRGAAATAIAWRAGGALRVTVIAKATFAFANAMPMPRAAPQPILGADIHHGGNPAQSVRFTNDLAPWLPRADVLFTGHAYVPSESGLDTLPVRLIIADGSRRALYKMLLVKMPDGLEQAPIVYERAYGGATCAENPIGVGAAPGSREPSILDPSDPKRPAGFGPIAPTWPARARLVPPASSGALRGPILDIPNGFDWSYFQAAPPDQRIEHLRGDEWIGLDGLLPRLPRATMRLPGARGVARVYGLYAFGVTEGQALHLSADTLRIDGDEQTCTVVWRGSFPIFGEAALASVRIAAGVEITGEPLEWPNPASWSRTQEAAPIQQIRGDFEEDEEVETVALRIKNGVAVGDGSGGDGAAQKPALPFNTTPGALSPLAQPSAQARVYTSEEAFSGTFMLTDNDERPVVATALPFRDAAPPPKAAAPSKPAPPPMTTAAPEPPAPPPPPAPARAEPPRPPYEPTPEPAKPPPNKASPWAPQPEPAPAPPPPPKRPPEIGPSAASPALKRGLYGKFGKS